MQFNHEFLGDQVANGRVYLDLHHLETQYSSHPLPVVLLPFIESGIRTPWVEGTGGFDESLNGICWQGDFPGVASISERDHYLALCSDPNLILRIPDL